MRIALLAIACFAGGCGADSTPEPTVLLGQRQLNGYHVLANAATATPDDSSGFLVTADGHGTFHLDWLAEAGATAHFSGSITTDGSFNPNDTVKRTGEESVQFATTGEISFSGDPGGELEGVSFAVNSVADPVYLDLSIDGTRLSAGIFFTGAVTGMVEQSAFDPVAFTSP